MKKGRAVIGGRVRVGEAIGVKRFFVSVILFCLAFSLQAKTWFVTASGTGNGNSWNQAASLADALAGASAADELWLAEGVYAGASIFAVTKNDLKLYGGFTTSMSSFGERDYQAYPTVLDGEGARQIMSVNSDGVRIDGLIFKKAATGGSGGCIAKTGSGAVIVANSSFSSNVMTYGSTRGIGAGIYAGGGTLTVTNCSFTDNSGTTYARGAGIYAINTQVVLRDSFFRGNKAGTQEKNGGGAVYIRSGQLDMSGCVFQTNTTYGFGSGAYGGAVSLSLNLNSQIRNCVFDGNKSGSGGAIAIWTTQNYTTIVENCTFAATNHAAFNGGALHVETGIVLSKNNIFSGNEAGLIGRNIYCSGGTIQEAYSCFDMAVNSLGGTVSESNCFFADPLFAGAGDFHLRSSQGRWDPGTKTWITDASEYSPCIDRGDPAADYSLEPMNNGARINLGAYGNTPEASKSYASAVPSVRNDPAAVTYNSVKMNGTLTAGGTARVIVYYGLNDGGTDPGGWDFSEEIVPSPRTDESFSVDKVGLVPQRQYYYRAYAFNSEGANWAGSSASFTTGSEPPGGGPGIIHVDKDATGLDTGTDWLNAYRTLAEGIQAADDERDDIWIATGDYQEGRVLSIEKSLSIYGGFTASMTSIDERDWEAHPTVLDGEGARQIMVVSAEAGRVDGLVFKKALPASGGGISKSGTGNLFVLNSTFADNVGGASGNGHGIYAGNGSLTVSNCVFTGNSGSTYAKGAGVYATNTQVVLQDSLFQNNKAGRQERNGGGAVYVKNGQLEMSGCVFQTNTTATLGQTAYGGAVSLSGNLNSLIENCVFDSNRAGSGGAIVVWTAQDYTTVVENCSFSSTNCAAYNGGAFFIEGGAALIKNSILWDNSATVSGSELYAKNATSRVDVAYSCLSGTDAPYVVTASDAAIDLGDGIIAEDPLFATSTDLHLQSKGGRWDPALSDWVADSVNSPCIDAGDPLDPFDDEPMPNGRRINMGAYGGTPEASKTDIPRGAILTVL